MTFWCFQSDTWSCIASTIDEIQNLFQNRLEFVSYQFRARFSKSQILYFFFFFCEYIFQELLRYFIQHNSP